MQVLSALVVAAGVLLSGGSDPMIDGTLVVLNKSEATASLLSRATGEEIKKVPTGVGPHEVAVSPDGRWAVVADYGAQQPGSTLTVIDMDKHEVAKTIELKQYHRPHGIMFHPNGRDVIVTAETERRLLVVDVTSGNVKHAIDTDQAVSHMVAISPDASRAYVANIGSDSISAIDLEKGELIKVVKTGPQAEGIDVSPDGSEVWVSNRQGNTISVINAETLEVEATLDCASFPIRLKFTPDGAHVLVSAMRTGDVAVFDAKARKEVRRISMDVKTVSDEEREGRLFSTTEAGNPAPIGILIPPDGKVAFIANTMADVVTVIDLESWTLVGRWPAGNEPDGLGYAK